MDRDEFEIPVFDADPALGAQHRGGPGRDGGRTGGARGLGIAIAAILLLTASVVAGGILEPPPPSASPAPTLIPTFVPCTNIATTSAPTFGIRAVGSDTGWGGAFGRSHVPGKVTRDLGWQVPVPNPGSPTHEVDSGVPLELFAAPGVCFWYVFAELADANIGHTPLPSERQPLMAQTLESPGPNPRIDQLPDGDWVLHVTADFETGVHSAAGLVASEFYFRVRVGPIPEPTPTPEPTPAVTPQVACGPVPATLDDIEVVMSAPSGDPVVGANGRLGPLVKVPLGEAPMISVVGDACATSWTISMLIGGTAQVAGVVSFSNPGDDPGRASQNRWVLPKTPMGTYDLEAQFAFGPGRSVVRTWRLATPEFVVPDTFLIATDGTRVRALPGCGLAFTLDNGFARGEPCSVSIGYPAGLRLLSVPAWSRVVIEIPGWTIGSWNGACGQIVTDGAGNQTFDQPNGCSLGGYGVPDGTAPPAPAQFLARPGEQVVQLQTHATRNGNAYDVPMYARIAGR